MLIDHEHPRLSVLRQCDLIGLPRSSLYYRAQGEDAQNQQLMRWIDREYTAHPFFGVRRMTAMLGRLGQTVNPKRVRRLMRVMGLEAVYPKPKTSLKNKGDLEYPYLLKGLLIDRPDQVWATDITYIPLERGWVYVAAVMDWFSRCVLAWEMSNTLDSSFCVEALKKAMALGTPEIFNSDQGSQFTSEAFAGVLKDAGIRISRDGVRRAYDNIFVERLWRSLKYEEVYLRDYQMIPEARRGICEWFEFYNHHRPHQALDYRTPAEVYGISKLKGSGTVTEAIDAAIAPVGPRPPCKRAALTGDEIHLKSG
jgi:putative transposase